MPMSTASTNPRWPTGLGRISPNASPGRLEEKRLRRRINNLWLFLEYQIKSANHGKASWVSAGKTHPDHYLYKAV
jgi:hypothetical protein